MENDPVQKNQFRHFRRIVWGFFLFIFGVLLLTGAIYVPFIYESQTLRYHFGADRNLLLTGHIMGTTAAVLIFFQLILISRITVLDRIFSINRLHLLHRINAALILSMALYHLLMILSILGTETLAPDVRQWPEYTGLLLLIMLTGIVFSGFFRKYIHMPYNYWFFFHRIFAPCVSLLLCVHVYFVSETFRYDNAHRLIIIFIISCFLIYILVRLKNSFFFRTACRITDIRMAGRLIHTLELVPEKEQRIINVPGQFAFIKIKSGNISMEEHPFTISSTPTRPPVLQFTIRSSGDWTKKVPNLIMNDRVFISGPFGIYGHLDLKSSRELIMIAGGIGITPMLSILRYLLDNKSDRKITLIWSNRTHEEVIYPDEFRSMENNMPNLDIQYLFTRETGDEEITGRLDRNSLKIRLSGCSRRSVVLLCGPPKMMSRVKKDLLFLGFHRRSIITERFSM